MISFSKIIIRKIEDQSELSTTKEIKTVMSKVVLASWIARLEVMLIQVKFMTTAILMLK